MLTKVENLNELFAIELRYAYDCEQKLVKKGLPSMIEAAGSTELKSALEHHLTETRRHVARLESIFSMAGIEPSTKDNEILDKMISAAKDSVGNIEPSALRDTALIANGNHVEHYEIAMYGTLADFARQLGVEGAVNPAQKGTKAAAHYTITAGAGETSEVCLRFTNREFPPERSAIFGPAFDTCFLQRQQEAVAHWRPSRSSASVFAFGAAGRLMPVSGVRP